MGLIREVERLGERAKNFVELSRVARYPLPEDDVTVALHAIHESVTVMLSDVPAILESGDIRQAKELDARGRHLIHECDGLIARAASGELPASHAVAITMAARLYARVQRQLVNLLGSLLVPVHVLDFDGVSPGEDLASI
jgi:phosphate uptake regulator